MNYQKIDIHVGPNLVAAKLETRKVCDCGMEAIKSEVPLGTRYKIDLRSVRWVRYQCFGCGKKIEVRVADAWTELLIPMWTFLDCLDIGQHIPIIRKPSSWTTVKDNQVAPAHYVPAGRIV